MKTLKPLIASIIFAAALPALADIEPPPPGMGGAELIETTATVEAVDQSSRYVTLKGPQGNLVTVKADDRVKNLDMIKPGDQINVKYYQSVAVDVVAGPDDASAPARQRSFSAGPGAAPGTASQQMRSIVQILSVDPYKKTIAFRDPEGRYREVSVKSPELKHYLDELKEGDTVQATFTEALSVSLEPR